VDTQLLTLSKIFTERLFRIPDYQRGYAWTEKQLKDFWSDLLQLETGRNHYTGVLTLESVPESTFTHWADDAWIVAAKSYQPYFVVDGQQRLTTAIILIQSILDRLQSSDKLNYTDRADIQRKFIFDSKNGGISRSYIFGYEKDNPSYEFLKTKVFCERSSTGTLQETVYTQNLAHAKEFFVERVNALTIEELEILYRKVTQSLLFNIFTISDEVDVCVAFETMNNRGKPLSYLELLKNRLIYLSLKFDEDESERNRLRRAINDCWKTIYHSLGKNKKRPLDDDRFLLTHYITYFGKVVDGEPPTIDAIRSLRIDHTSELLEKRFITNNVSKDAPEDMRVTLNSMYQYVSSLQDAVESWYKIFNPFESDFSWSTQIWLDKLNRIGIDFHLPLVLVYLQKVTGDSKRLNFLQAVERQIFVLSFMGRNYGRLLSRGLDSLMLSRGMFAPKLLELAIDLNIGKTSAEKVTKHIVDETNSLLKGENFREAKKRFQIDGFYNWERVRYLLFEYNLHLQEKSKTEREKIFWPEFIEEKKDFISVEHIYPQQPKHEYWKSQFSGLKPKQYKTLRNSLGNLLPLSKPKNSSLSNKPFHEKVKGKEGSTIGYCYGCYAENEVTQYAEWTPINILDRGQKMLSFMEKRWLLDLGSDKDKAVMLGLDFLL
jgi:Protein of unknown function DUF262/Protein of unknown function (DUF1524)